MRKTLSLLVVLLLCGSGAWAQGFIRYYPPSGGGGGGMADPGADGIMVRTAADTSSARSITSPAGTIAITNADGVSGNIGLDVDTSIYGQFSSGTATVSGNCTLGDTYLETDTNLWSMCTSTNTWRTAVTFSETATTGMGFVIDEDNMASNSATKVPTQQSVKAYVDANAGSLDPGTAFELYDDFLSGDPASAGETGSSGIRWGAISTGTVAGIDSVANHPGLLQLLSHASNDNSGIVVDWGNVGGQLAAGLSGDWSFDAVVALNSVTDVALYVGFTNVLSDPPPNASNGTWIRFDTGQGDATFIAQLCDVNAADGCTASGDDTNSNVAASSITPVAGTYYRIRIERLTSGVGGNPTIYMRVNDEAAMTFCSAGCTDVISNFGTSSATSPHITWLTRTTTGVQTMNIDYMMLRFSGLTRY